MGLIQLVVQIGNPLTRSYRFCLTLFRQLGEQRVSRGACGIRDLQITKRLQRPPGRQRPSPAGCWYRFFRRDPRRKRAGLTLVSLARFRTVLTRVSQEPLQRMAPFSSTAATCRSADSRRASRPFSEDCSIWWNDSSHRYPSDSCLRHPGSVPVRGTD